MKEIVFFVEGTPEVVSSKLARLIDCSNPNNTGTGVEKKLDMNKFDPATLKEKFELDMNKISKVFTVNLLHRNRMMSEIVMVFLGQQSGLRALVIGLKNRPGVRGNPYLFKRFYPAS